MKRQYTLDEAHKSKNDKFIPLDKEIGQPVSPVV